MKSISPLRVFLIIAVSFIPVILGSMVYNLVDCTTLDDKNYQAWLEQGNKGTTKDMINSCNYIHPIILYAIIPTSPILAFIVWYTTREGFYETSNTESSSTKGGKSP